MTNYRKSKLNLGAPYCLSLVIYWRRMFMYWGIALEAWFYGWMLWETSRGRWTCLLTRTCSCGSM